MISYFLSLVVLHYIYICLVYKGLTARASRLLCCRLMLCGEGKVGMGGATEMEMVTLFLSRLEESCSCCSSDASKNIHENWLSVKTEQIYCCFAPTVGYFALTSMQSSETQLSISVEFLETWWSGTWVKHVVLLVPWSLIVHRQLALYIQIRHR